MPIAAFIVAGQVTGHCPGMRLYGEVRARRPRPQLSSALFSIRTSSYILVDRAYSPLSANPWYIQCNSFLSCWSISHKSDQQRHVTCNPKTSLPRVLVLPRQQSRNRLRDNSFRPHVGMYDRIVYDRQPLTSGQPIINLSSKHGLVHFAYF